MRFFNSLINGRRIRLSINRIKNKEGEWIEGTNQEVGAAVDFYQDQFTKLQKSADFSLLKFIPNLVSGESNSAINALPPERRQRRQYLILYRQRVWSEYVFWSFFQKCWNVVGEDVYRVVVTIFYKETLIRNPHSH